MPRCVLCVFILLYSITVVAQKSREEQLKELEALEAELGSLEQKEKQQQSFYEEEQKKLALDDEIGVLNLKYMEVYSGGDRTSLQTIIKEIITLIKDPDVNLCYSGAQIAMLNIGDYYSTQGYQDDFEKLLALVPADCKTLGREYLLIANSIQTGKTDKAMQVIEQGVFTLPEKCMDESGDLTINCYSDITAQSLPEIAGMYMAAVSVAYQQAGNFETAARYGKLAIAWYRFLGMPNEEFATALSLATLYNTTNQLNEVVKILTPYKDTMDQYLWTYQNEYYKLMAAVADTKGDEEEREMYQNKSEQIKSEHKVVTSIEDQINSAYELYQMEEVGMFFNTVSSASQSEAASSLENIMNQMEEKQEYNSIYYAKVILLLAASYENSITSWVNYKDFLLKKLPNITNKRSRGLIYYYLGKKEFHELNYEGIQYLETALELFKQLKDKLSEFQIKQMLATFYDIYEMNDKAIDKYRDALIDAEILIDQYYPYLTEKEQYQFNIRWIQTLERSVFTFYSRQPDTSKKQLTNILLKFRMQTKGLLLQNSVKTQLAIHESDDESLKQSFANLTQLKRELSMGQEQLSWQEKKALADKIEALEEQINQTLGITETESKKSFKIVDIQKALAPNEFAIETVRTQVGTGRYLSDTINYTFFIIPSTGDVKVISLRNSTTLETRDYSFYTKAIKFKIEDNNSYSKYWSFFENYITEDATIFISVDGIFNGVSLNTLYNPSSQEYLYEQNTIIQISSLRDILKKSKKKQMVINKSVFVGRPKYYNAQDTTAVQERGALMADLPGTEQEIKAISEKLAAVQSPFETYIGEEATENIVKQVNSPTILHIATHGYFKKKDQNNDFFDSPMLSASLLLTGAGASATPEGEDGILTAYEITSVNLIDTELVVLSACESGVGENRDGQGVYGLSRAFFVAGAEAVVSSLWKVDDTATQKFMELFYTDWLKHGNLRKSMQYARDEVRKQYPEPYYWGAFVATGI